MTAMPRFVAAAGLVAPVPFMKKANEAGLPYRTSRHSCILHIKADLHTHRPSWSPVGRASARHRGFTLLEVLVAVAVFAVFSTLAYGSLSRLLDSRDRIEAERTFWRELALAFTRIEDDLGAARTRAVRDLYGNPMPAFRGQPTDGRVLGEPAMAFTRGGLFVLGDSTRPDLARVGYRLRDGALQRIAWPALDQPTRSEPQIAALLENVTELRVRFYAPAGGWVDSWPPTGQLNALPAAVEVGLTLEGRGDFERILRVGG